MIIRSRHALAVTVAAALAASAHATVIYDGSLGTSVPSQGWLGYGEFNGSGSVTVAGGATRVSTLTSNSVFAGFSTDILVGFTPTRVNPAFPVLNAATGFTVRFDLRMHASESPTIDRAGFSLTVVSSVTSKAIELAFPVGSVFAQEGGTAPQLFTAAESAELDNSSRLVRYDLAVLGSEYTLYADGASLLTGTLRNYTAFTTPSPLNPYRTASFLAFADNTSSARGDWSLSYAEVLPFAVPTPGAAAVGVVGLLAMGRRSRQRG